MADYPTNPKELTAEWLAATLGAAGVLHGTTVKSFSTSPVGEGIGMLGILAASRSSTTGLHPRHRKR